MKLSIVTPSFNQGEFIERTIQSVITQQDDCLEYVVMDGGSTDQTLEILRQYQTHLTWVSEPDKGQSHAVNKGIMNTSGEIIGWLNSDDIYYPQTFQKIRQFFAKHPEIDVVYGDADFIDREGKKLYRYPTERWNLQRFKSVCFISQPATFFRRRVVEQYGLIDESLNFCMDYEYWLRLALKGAKIAYLPQVLAGARVYPETKTSSCVVEASLEAMSMLQKTLGKIPPAWTLNYASALVKTSSQLRYPQLRFIAAVWMNLWRATAINYRGFARISAWFAAQKAMVDRFFNRLLSSES